MAKNVTSFIYFSKKLKKHIDNKLARIVKMRKENKLRKLLHHNSIGTPKLDWHIYIFFQLYANVSTKKINLNLTY